MPSAAARLGTKLAGSAITFAILQSATRRGESSPALYTVYALADIALHLMCIQAVSFGAMTALERYVTAQRLTPPPLPSSPSTPPPAPPVKGWRKGLQVVKGMLVPALALTPSIGIHLIERYVRSPVLIDGLNIIVQFGLIWFMTAHALHVLYTTPRLELKLAPATGRRGYTLEDNVKDSNRLKLVAAGMSIAALSMSYLGYPRAGYVVGVTWVAAMISTSFFQRLRAGTMIMTYLGIMIITPLIIFGCTALFNKPKDAASGPAEEQKKPSIMPPSRWIVDMMQIFAVFPLYLFSGTFIAIGLRHDYMSTAPSSSVALKGEPGESVAVSDSTDSLFERTQLDGSIVKLPKPAYTAGMTTVVITTLVLKVYIAVKGIDGREKSDLECRLMGAPVLVCLAILAKKWQVGQLASWWNHSEIWIPPAPDAEAVQDVDDVEKTLWDEKTVGIDVSTATETDAVVVA